MKDRPETDRKFTDPDITADGQPRARVALSRPQTLWFNTGTLCNIECAGCYIESSPQNDRLVYLTLPEVTSFLDQLDTRSWPVHEIGFTGGEPFMNPAMIDMTQAALARGYDVLILTNAMRPMMRPAVQLGLKSLIAEYPDKLTLRVSLDHYSPEKNDEIRGTGSFDSALDGLRWLRDQGARISLAGRTLWTETEAGMRAGFGALIAREGLKVDPQDPGQLVLFPEMDETVPVPEITTACWDILGKSPDSVMCASSRMVVRRKGADRPSVLACTLLPYDPRFDMGSTLEQAEADVALNHPHCAKFCVLGGASCSA